MFRILHQRDGFVRHFPGPGMMLFTADAGPVRFIRHALFDEAQGRLHGENTGDCFIHPFPGKQAPFDAVLHVCHIFRQTLVEQKHIRARGDGGGHGVRAFHGAVVAHHGRGVGDNQAIEPQVLPQKAGHQFF